MTTTLRDHLAEYLAMRRELGYRLDKLELLAGQFCDWLTAADKTTFTIADAVIWARLPGEADPTWWALRLGAVRTFAAYLQAIGVDVQVPPRGMLPVRTPRCLTPYIYSQQDLNLLLEACPRVFTRELVTATMRTVIALLAATGMRIGEALRLRPADIDPSAGVLTVRATKNGTDRLVALHDSTTAALTAYQMLPARSATRPQADGPLLVTTGGTGYHRATIETHFTNVVAAAGLPPRGRSRPTLHALRHTFATAHMAAAYRAGTDPHRTLTLLATWLGHTSAAHTYWYLTATPELMALAANRVENANRLQNNELSTP
jgi:integrase